MSEAHPGEPHEFTTTCSRCGESGHLFVAVITDDEMVRIESRDAAALAAEPDDGLRAALVEALDILGHLDRQSDPGHDRPHDVMVTGFTWRDAISPRIARLRFALATSPEPVDAKP